MAKTKSGVLYLSKTEREALAIIAHHTKVDISYGEGGSFNKEDKNGGYPFDAKDAKKAERGIELIRFILEITQ